MTIAPFFAAQRAKLDHVFGVDGYTVGTPDPNQVIVRTAQFEWDVRYDTMRGELTSYVSDVPWTVTFGLDTWVRFLGERIPSQPTDTAGCASASAEWLAAEELKWMEKLSREVLSDPERMREAASFVRGYCRAYNDWAEGGRMWEGR